MNAIVTSKVQKEVQKAKAQLAHLDNKTRKAATILESKKQEISDTNSKLPIKQLQHNSSSSSISSESSSSSYESNISISISYSMSKIVKISNKNEEYKLKNDLVTPKIQKVRAVERMDPILTK